MNLNIFPPLGEGEREGESADCDPLLIQNIRKELISLEALGELDTGAQILSGFCQSALVFYIHLRVTSQFTSLHRNKGIRRPC